MVYIIFLILSSATRLKISWENRALALFCIEIRACGYECAFPSCFPVREFAHTHTSMCVGNCLMRICSTTEVLALDLFHCPALKCLITKINWKLSFFTIFAVVGHSCARQTLMSGKYLSLFSFLFLWPKTKAYSLSSIPPSFIRRVCVHGFCFLLVLSLWFIIAMLNKNLW